MKFTYRSASQIGRVLKKPTNKVHCFWGQTFLEDLLDENDVSPTETNFHAVMIRC
jgi:hypothetical protein